MIVVLALGWSLLLAAPLVHLARRVRPRTRAGTLRAAGSSTHATRPRAARLLAQVPEPLRRMIASVVTRRQERRIDGVIERELPVTIDLLAVAVGAGCTPFLAVDTAIAWSSPALAGELAGVRRACALGRAFDAALDDLARRIPRLAPLVDALLASDRFGAPVGDALLRLASEQRTVLRRRAEARARTVPVRLLFPLVFLVLPAFALLTVVPAVLGGLGGT